MADMTPLDRAIEHCGGLGRLADSLKVTYQAVQKWRKKGVPAERCRDVEAVTGGAVTRYELRPDVFGPPPAGKREAA